MENSICNGVFCVTFRIWKSYPKIYRTESVPPSLVGLTFSLCLLFISTKSSPPSSLTDLLWSQVGLSLSIFDVFHISFFTVPATERFRRNVHLPQNSHQAATPIIEDWHCHTHSSFYSLQSMMFAFGAVLPYAVEGFILILTVPTQTLDEKFSFWKIFPYWVYCLHDCWGEVIVCTMGVIFTCLFSF